MDDADALPMASITRSLVRSSLLRGANPVRRRATIASASVDDDKPPEGVLKRQTSEAGPLRAVEEAAVGPPRITRSLARHKTIGTMRSVGSVGSLHEHRRSSSSSSTTAGTPSPASRQGSKDKLFRRVPTTGRGRSKEVSGGGGRVWHAADSQHMRSAQVHYLSRRWDLEKDDVERILGLLDRAAERNGGVINSLEFRSLLPRACNKGTLSEVTINSAWEACLASGGEDVKAPEFDIDRFLEWVIADRRWDTIEALTHWSPSDHVLNGLAKEHGVTRAVIDTVKVAFAECDDDKSGECDYSEFRVMMQQVSMRSQEEAGISEVEILRLWNEMDCERKGVVDFPPFVRWYLKYIDHETGQLRPGAAEAH